jgi:hypothetical protein
MKRALPLSTQSDIDRYLDSDVLEWDDNDIRNYDPEFVLKWWKANESQYPIMAKAARDLLAVPGSEVDVERLFYGGRDLLGIRRYGLLFVAHGKKVASWACGVVELAWCSILYGIRTSVRCLVTV